MSGMAPVQTCVLPAAKIRLLKVQLYSPKLLMGGSKHLEVNSSCRTFFNKIYVSKATTADYDPARPTPNECVCDTPTEHLRGSYLRLLGVPCE